jgi:hypothetical protein
VRDAAQRLLDARATHRTPEAGLWRQVMSSFFGGLAGSEADHEEATRENFRRLKFAHEAFKTAKASKHRGTALTLAVDVIEFGARMRQETHWYHGPRARDMVRLAESMMDDARSYIVGSKS